MSSAGTASRRGGKHFWFLTCATALALCQAPSHAQAQDSSVTEVIVTARKRQESILNVPVIETALQREQLERLQTRDLKDVAKMVPGLLLGTSDGASGVQLSIRGVGTITTDPAVEQTVALNIDGVQMYQGQAFTVGMFDVGQVEVLKGPQSLFYGKSAPGGVVSIRTADPTNDVEVIGRAMYELEAREKRAELVVSGPVSDQLKLRLAGMYSHSDGYFYNLAVPVTALGGAAPDGTRLGPDKTYMLRGTALWEPTNTFSARLKASITEDRQEFGGMGQLVSCPEGVNAPIGIPFVGNGEDCKLDRTARIVGFTAQAFPALGAQTTPLLQIAQQYGSLELNWRPMPEITLTSVSGYYHLHSHIITNATYSTAAGPAFAIRNSNRRYDYSEELRANTDFHGPLNFTGGVFLQKSHFSPTSILDGNITELSPAFTFLTNSIGRVDIKSFSPFGQARWKPTEKLEVALGARWTNEKRDLAVSDRITGVTVPLPLAVTHLHSKRLSPELTLTYKPSDDITVFGSLKKGYKSGSFSFGGSPAPGDDISYGDEQVKGGELGVKGRMLDRRLTFETAYFDYRYTGLQESGIQPVEGKPPQIKTVNAGSARTYGVEAKLSYSPEQVEGLNLFVNGQWNRARFKVLDNIPCIDGQLVSEGCDRAFNPQANLGLGGFTAQSLNGAPLPRAPKWQVQFGFNYEMPLADGKTILFSNNNSYYSRYLLILGKRPDFYQSAFLKSDLSVALRGAEDRWEVALVGKNITDKLTKGSCNAGPLMTGALLSGFTGLTTAGPAGKDAVACRVDQGREVWLRVTYKPLS